jgi:hypothetical protein
LEEVRRAGHPRKFGLLCCGIGSVTQESAMPQNAYPDKPRAPYVKTAVAMHDVVHYLQNADVPTEVKRSTYVIFRNESGNGAAGINNNYVGAQADSGRWPPKFDDSIVGTVVTDENHTGRERIFVAFKSWTDSVDFLADRVLSRGMFVGSETHVVLKMAIADGNDLARAYHKEWVTGSAISEPGAAEVNSFLNMYEQAEALFS